MTPNLDPDLLRAFLAVADHRSFTRAATTLNRTQSAVSMQVKRLEQQLHAELFHRAKPNLDLSPAGEQLLGYARRILSLNEEAVGRVREHRVEGRVRLGVMDDYGAKLLPPLLARFIASYPLIDVEMETGLTSTMTDRLGKTYDIVIAMHPEGHSEGELLRREQAMWAASADHRVEYSDPLPVALYPRGCLFRAWAMQALDRANRPWRLAFVSHSLAAVEAIAAEGLAVTVFKSGTFPSRLRPLSRRDGLPPLPRADIRLHRAQKLSRAAALLADHLVASLAEPVRRKAMRR